MRVWAKIEKGEVTGRIKHVVALIMMLVWAENEKDNPS